MSIIGSNVLAGASGSGVSAYEIEQSLRFDGSQRLVRTASSDGGNTFTFSVWLKTTIKNSGFVVFQGTQSDSNYGTSGAYDGGGWYSDGPYFSAGANSSNKWDYYLGAIDNTQKYRDPSAWYHIVWKSDSTTGYMYVNGVLRGSETRTQSFEYWNQSGHPQHIGAYRAPAGSLSSFFDGYMAETHFVDGTALDPDNFGEYDDNGVWRPIEADISDYGTNGFYLKFDPDATNGIGHDHSGNGNNFTASSGFVTTGTGTDVMSDTPTNNYCTLNPLAVTASTGTMSDGNLVGTTTVSNGGNMYGTFALPSTGKWYWEVVSNSGNGAIIGIGEYDPTEDQAWELSNSAFIYDYPGEGQKIVDGTSSTYGSDFTNGDLIGVACDADADTIEFYIDGTAQGSISHTIGGLFPCLCDGSDSAAACTLTVNFGQRAFEQTPPSGYKALNTSNLPAPDIADGSEYFNTALYSGTGATQSITGVGFQPDLIWFKRRSVVEHHLVQDAIRGVTKLLYPSSTSTEDTRTDQLTSFDTDGFTLGADAAGYSNKTGTYVAWNWLAGNGTSNNTNGTITSTVSVNPSAGFSIVSYTGTGTAGTVGHGLGVAPSFYVVKNRDGAYFWPCYHASLTNPATTYIGLDEDTVEQTGETHWNSTAPTSTVFSVNTQLSVNTSPNKYIAYCFAEVEGYSKFGSYTGNSSTDGTFVYCGFRPAWVMIKVTNIATTNWIVFDSVRQTYNVIGPWLMPSSNAAEIDSAYIDFLSNGFKLRVNNNLVNSSSGTYIFAAFAEHPTGGSGVSPATAR